MQSKINPLFKVAHWRAALRGNSQRVAGVAVGSSRQAIEWEDAAAAVAPLSQFVGYDVEIRRAEKVGRRRNTKHGLGKCREVPAASQVVDVDFAAVLLAADEKFATPNIAARAVEKQREPVNCLRS